eukprot:TRINITY_DN11715_c0_g1_i1.p1 TRINITY_DN11715_c0_g1~~TRINITY_DN11715_c0_g1_i1.p1  ORF type:complete len:201 (-),score=48.33 TRINITY_DN11715_c0_g1_i1:24-626(-)
MSYDAKIRVVTLGRYRVGKTSVSRRFVQDKFDDNQFSTVGVLHLERVLEVDSGFKLKIEIWDTAGQEQYEALTEQYWRGAHCALFIFDLTLKESYERAQYWVNKLKLNRKEDLPLMIMVGNKCDREEERVISKEDAEKFTKTENIYYFETSAKTGGGIKELFNHIAKEVKIPEESKGVRPPEADLASFDQRNQGGCCVII